jgi:hypothetical protein
LKNETTGYVLHDKCNLAKDFKFADVLFDTTTISDADELVGQWSSHGIVERRVEVRLGCVESGCLVAVWKYFRFKHILK